MAGQGTNPIDQRVNELWAMPTQDWPKPLQDAVQEAFHKLGKCGEVAHDAIRQFVMHSPAERKARADA